MSEPSLQLCPDAELRVFMRSLITSIGVVLRQVRLPTNPAPGTTRVDLIPNSQPRRTVGEAVGLSYGNIERIEAGAVQPRIRTLKAISAGVGGSLPSTVARAWLNVVAPDQPMVGCLKKALQICDRIPGPSDSELPIRLGEALRDLRGPIEPNKIADSAWLSRGYYFQLERGQRNGSLWAFIAASDALLSSFPALLVLAWTAGEPLTDSELKAISCARSLLARFRWRGVAARPVS